MAGTSVALGGNSLQTTTIITNNVDHHSMPDIDAKQYPFAHAPGSTIPFTNFPSKTIPLTGTLTAANVAAMDALVDTFKAYFLGTNLTLDIGYNGSTRRYLATANTPVKIVRPGGLAWGTYEAQMVCNNPFGMDTTATSLTPNLLANGDFEVNTTGWSAFAAATISQSSTHANTGTFSLQAVTTTGANKGVQLNFVAVSPSTTYTISFATYAASSQLYGFEVDQYTAGSSFISATNGSNTGTAAWQNNSVTFTTANNCTQIELLVYENASATFWVDSVQLQTGSVATSFIQSIGRTLGIYQDAITFNGTAPWQLPVATFTFSVLTGGTNGQLTWGNAATGQAITIIRTWSATDVLVIDSTQSSVTVNGAAVNFFGAFPTFPPGPGNMYYSDTFTTRTFTMGVTYTAYYL